MKKLQEPDMIRQSIRIRNEDKSIQRKNKNKHASKKPPLRRIFSRTEVVAPDSLDIFNKYNEFIEFITQIRDLVLNGKKVLINFRNTKALKASSVVVLYAHIEFFQRVTNKSDVISITPGYNQKVNSWFKNTGIWGLTKFQSGVVDGLLPVVSAVTGTPNDDNKTRETKNKIREIFKFIKETLYSGDISEKESMELYVAITESISNVGLHAYPIDTDASYLEFVDNIGKRWWILARSVQSQLFIVIYDMGEGIPCSLVKRDFFSVIKQMFSPESDADKIQSALKYGETRMNSEKHGKGLPEIKKYVVDNPMGELHIFSGMGYFSYCVDDDQETKKNLSYSIGGTLIQWNVCLNDGEKK